MKIHTLFFFVIINISNLLAQELLKVDIESEIDKGNFTINLSDYIETIKYVPLETNSNCLIDRNPEFTVSNNSIVVKTLSDCFIFEKETGKFLNKISRKGRGPGEYQSTMGFTNPFNQTIYFSEAGLKLLKFDFLGTFMKSINIPESNKSIESPSIPGNYTWLNNDIVIYFGNLTGTEKKKLIILNEDGKKLVVFPNHNYFAESKGFSISAYESQFYHFNHNLYFKEDYSDTVFQVTKSQLIPQKRLYLGKYQPAVESKWMTERELKDRQFIVLRDLVESKSFFLFKVLFQDKYFQGVYNKNTKKLKIAKIDSNVRNDIDSFMLFAPITISTDGYLISFANAYDILAWFKQNPDKAAKLPLHLQELKKLKENDNPVVIMAKLKE